ncbi:hypothetical protein Tco_0619447 [Tanacetum coccineum]
MAASEEAMYSTSIEDIAIVLCLALFQSMAPPLCMKTYPDWDYLSCCDVPWELAQLLDFVSYDASTGIEGHAECKASASNLRRIQVKDIVKEVKDYLKTYSSAGMDSSWYVEGIRRSSKESQRWQYSDYPITL